MQKEIYNEFYKKHGAGIHRDDIRFIETAKLCKGKVLDIACGTGDLADFYHRQYVGFDISDVAIKMAQEKQSSEQEFFIKNALILDTEATPQFDTIDTEATPQFDTIVMAEFLEHIKNDDVVFQNIKKWALPNARIIISVPNGNRIPDINHLREFTTPKLRAKFSSLGKVTFHNWIGFEGRILMTVDLAEKNTNDLTLAMIVKDEEKGLEKAILSCIEFVDKIVISVDSKSTDKTIEIATRYADTLKIHTWENNFASARNFVNESITSKWILSLDGHEFIEQAPKIKEKLLADTDSLMVTIKMEGGDTFITPRIYRTEIKWEHAIHNAIPAKTTEKYTDFIICHDREGGQTIKSRNERKEQVKVMMKNELEKELKIPASRERALFYLARYYRQFGEWKKALKYYKKYLKTKSYIGQKWLCAYEAGIIACAIGKPLKAISFFNQANTLIPNRWEISKHIGLAYLTFCQYPKAVIYLVDSLKENTGEFSFNPEKRDNSDTWDKIGVCFFNLKKWNEAKTAWERAIETGKDLDQNKLNKKRIELLEHEKGV